MDAERRAEARYQVYELGIGDSVELIGVRPATSRTTPEAVVAQTIRWLQGLSSDSPPGLLHGSVGRLRSVVDGLPNQTKDVRRAGLAVQGPSAPPGTWRMDWLADDLDHGQAVETVRARARDLGVPGRIVRGSVPVR